MYKLYACHRRLGNMRSFAPHCNIEVTLKFQISTAGFTKIRIIYSKSITRDCMSVKVSLKYTMFDL